MEPHEGPTESLSGLARAAFEQLRAADLAGAESERAEQRATAAAFLAADRGLDAEAAELWTALGARLILRRHANAAQFNQALGFFQEAMKLLEGAGGAEAIRTRVWALAGASTAWTRMPTDSEGALVGEALAAARAALELERPGPNATWTDEDAAVAAVWGDLLGHSALRSAVTDGDVTAAASFARSVIARHADTRSTAAAAATYLLALAELHAEDRPAAIAHLREAAELAQAHGDVFAEARSLTRLANALMEQNPASAGGEAAGLQRQAAELFAKADDAPTAADCLRAAGAFYASAGEWEPAADAFAASARVSEAAIDRALLKPRVDEATSLRAMAEQAQVLCLVRLGRAGDAAVAADRARARRLRAIPRSFSPEFATVRERAPLLAQQFLDAQREVRLAEVAEMDLRDRAATPAATVDDLAALTDRLRAAKQTRAEVVERLRAVPGVEGGFGPLTLEEIQAAVPPGALLAYVVATPHGGVAVLLDGSAARSIDLPRLTSDALGRRLIAAAGRFDAWRATPSDPTVLQDFQQELDAGGEWLWQAMMADVLAAAEGHERLIVSASGGLEFLPLHAAWHTGDGGDRVYALDVLPISLAPAADLIPSTAHTGRPETLLMVGDPRPTSYAPLPQARLEAAALAPAFDDKTLAGADATEMAVLAALPQRDAVHLACHATARFGAPYGSHLVLACDAQLQLSEIVDLELPRRPEVFLSACESTLQDLALADEVQSIAAGFLSAGARCVVATLWPVFDASASLMAVAFYDRRLAGDSALASLRGAQRWMRDTTPDEKVTAVEAMTWIEPAAREAVAAAVKEPGLDLRWPVCWAPYVYSGA